MAETLPFRARGAPADFDQPDPPEHLSEDAERIWHSICRDWVLGPDALPLLRLACEAFDRYAEATNILREEGPVVKNPDSGNLHAHPAHQVARDNLKEFRQLFRQLHLDPPEAV